MFQKSRKVALRGILFLVIINVMSFQEMRAVAEEKNSFKKKNTSKLKPTPFVSKVVSEKTKDLDPTTVSSRTKTTGEPPLSKQKVSSARASTPVTEISQQNNSLNSYEVELTSDILNHTTQGLSNPNVIGAVGLDSMDLSPQGNGETSEQQQATQDAVEIDGNESLYD
ncbi:MAG: hypothetical protein B7Y25_03000 [Alphaproteobacteria bacterium 16-39-46]|nr:MAG: hypothetical protein B7Y25_03000 [Alphaproteobacteria bacterium 16-39-46]OZA43437.1 MAG: hypothetical protein B7X84_03225 [Alphaproteobacteria bacterium 17-39-52]HQS83852.1 hypothetical protein [Alphaproteobacteria bacterium]HQS93735.1 hypothetical protein [Alphaproteobacteria bacterium]